MSESFVTRIQAGAPRFSFVIPAYNEEAEIADCIRNILAQRENHPAGFFEILVVDNNSTDATASVALAAGADRVVRCLEQGIAAARNAGAREARGEFVCFVDADNRISPRWLHGAEEALARACCVAVSGWNLFSDPSLCRAAFYNFYNLYFFLGFFLAQCFRGGLVVGNNMVINRSVFLEHGGFPRLVGEDVKLGAILRKNGVRTTFSRHMKGVLSSRRFRRQGFWNVIGLWISTLAKDIPEQNYRLDYAGKTEQTKQEGGEVGK